MLEFLLKFYMPTFDRDGAESLGIFLAHTFFGTCGFSLHLPALWSFSAFSPTLPVLEDPHDIPGLT